MDNATKAQRIVACLEGHFRDWLRSDEHAEAVNLVREVLDEMDSTSNSAEPRETHP